MDEQGEYQEKERFPKWAKVFIPDQHVKVTPVLLVINILVWVIMVISGVSPMGPDPETALKWGATLTENVAAGEYWRLITSNYIHYGLMHLAFNMFALNNVGRTLERFIGSLRFGLLYVLSGIAASSVSVWWNPYAVGAGASGAILGIVGVFAALLTTNLIERTARMEMLRSIGISVGLTLLMGLNAHIDNAAHIGGLLAGGAGGYLIYFDLKARYMERRNSYIGILAACVLLMGTTVFFNSRLESILSSRRPENIFLDMSNGEAGIVTNYQNGKYSRPEDFEKEVLPAYDKFIRQADSIIEITENDEARIHFELVKTYLQTRRKGYYYEQKSFFDPVFSDSSELWMMKAEAQLRKLNGQ
ncbi:MAG: rhomboid family intramembrane serine protease [Bacteroidia bacterium]|nr:rhomboid family intramembrane serine protease [Bacteroidia bacterium]